MTKAHAPDERVHLDNGRSVPRSDYQRVVQAVEQFLPTMVLGHSYSVETMVGQKIWRSPLKWHAGAIVAHAVRREFLPLKFAYNGKRATKLYELITRILR